MAKTINRRRLPLLLGIAVAAIAMASGVLLMRANASSRSGAPVWLRTLATRVARADGDATPTSARWVLTTERAAAPLVGLTAATAPDNAPVYVVVMTGKFTDRHASYPPAVSAPTGTCIAFTVDAADHVIRDFGMSGLVNTSSVGPMEPLAPR